IGWEVLRRAAGAAGTPAPAATTSATAPTAAPATTIFAAIARRRWRRGRVGRTRQRVGAGTALDPIAKERHIAGPWIVDPFLVGKRHGLGGHPDIDQRVLGITRLDVPCAKGHVFGIRILRRSRSLELGNIVYEVEVSARLLRRGSDVAEMAGVIEE